MPDYQHSKIYKLVNNINDNFYIGSTTKKRLCERKNGHYQDSKKKSNLLFDEINQYGIKNFEIILIESYPCNSKDELRARENYWINQLNPNLNTRRAKTTYEERLEDKRINNSNYYYRNREKILEKMRKMKI